MNELERLFAQQQSVGLLQSIELAAWSIVGLLLVAVAVLLFQAVQRRGAKHEPKSDWIETVEKPYEAGHYDKALQALATFELFSPRSAQVKFWQGRCHFQRESWAQAAEKFEACCRLEPPYRRSVRDYMGFIELNDLVPGVTGYLRKRKSVTDHGDEGA